MIGDVSVSSRACSSRSDPKPAARGGPEPHLELPWVYVQLLPHLARSAGTAATAFAVAPPVSAVTPLGPPIGPPTIGPPNDRRSTAVPRHRGAPAVNRSSVSPASLVRPPRYL